MTEKCVIKTCSMSKWHLNVVATGPRGVFVMSELIRTVRHEDITMNDFIKQTEFQKHVPLLKSWKIEYTETFRVAYIPPGFCTHLSGKSLNRLQSVNVFHKMRVPNRYSILQ